VATALRTDKGWTVDQVAERLSCSASKISRMETGQRGASVRDMRDLCDIYGVDNEQGQRLMDLAAAGRQQTWWQARVLPYSTYVSLEADAASISDYALAIVPRALANCRVRARDLQQDRAPSAPPGCRAAA
jgi:transcriptional regulator with XRE-family HTH domain